MLAGKKLPDILKTICQPTEDKGLHGKYSEFGKEEGYVETMFHRVRHIPELKSPNYQVREFGKELP